MKHIIKVLFVIMALSLSQVSVEAAGKRKAAEELEGKIGSERKAEITVPIIFHGIPVTPQSVAPSQSNRCGYHALFNAARFSRVFASSENLGLPTLEGRIANFGQTVFGPDSEKVLNNAIEGNGGWGLRIRPAGSYLGGISEEEITKIIDIGGDGARSLKSRCEDGILSIWGSMTDFEHSMGELFSYDRMGRSMRALQQGRPVGFCVCLNEEVATASGGTRAGGGGGVWHWVSFGLVPAGNDIHVFTMDSLGDHFTLILKRRIENVVKTMMLNDPVRLAIEHTLATPCDSLIWRIVSRDGSTQVSGDGVRSVSAYGDVDYSDVEGDSVKELIQSVMFPAFKEIFKNFPSSVAIITDIIEKTDFTQFDHQLAVPSGQYRDKILDLLAIYISTT